MWKGLGDGKFGSGVLFLIAATGSMTTAVIIASTGAKYIEPEKKKKKE